MAAKKTKKAPAKKKATKRAAKRPAAKRKGKAKLSPRELASTFARAVNAGSVAMARKLAKELKRHSPYGVYSAEGVSAHDLRAFEALTTRRGRKR